MSCDKEALKRCTGRRLLTAGIGCQPAAIHDSNFSS
jgi:hypothetical protein